MSAEEQMRQMVEAELTARRKHVADELAAGKAPFDRQAMAELLLEVSAKPDTSDMSLRDWEQRYFHVYVHCRSMAELAEHLRKVAPFSNL